MWFEHFANRVAGIYFRRLATMDCVFIQDGSKPTSIVCYVEELLIFREESMVWSVNEKLARLFTVICLRACAEFLGMKVMVDKVGVTLLHEAMIDKIIAKSGMDAAKVACSPLPLGHEMYEEVKTVSDGKRSAMDSTPYRNILGGLLSIVTHISSDIAMAESRLAKFQDGAGSRH